MEKEVDYLQLARAARLEGNTKLFWTYFKNHARVMRKKMTPVQRSQG